MARIIRAMTRDGSARAFIIEGRDIVNRGIQIHNTAPTASAALGRVLLAASLMGSMMGEKEDALTLRFQGDGEGGTVLASSDYCGNVRGLIGNPECDLPLRERDGKLDVGRCIGDGYLTVIRDAGGKEPWQGTCEIQTGEVAEDIAYYYAFSEQVPTLCALGVLVDTDYSCKEAGGIIVQLLPFADEEVAAKLEENAKKMPPITTALQMASIEDILAGYLDGIPFDIFDEIDCGYRCDCSRDRTDIALISLGKKQLQELIDGEEETMEMTCRFCDNIYKYSKDDLRALLESL